MVEIVTTSIIFLQVFDIFTAIKCSIPKLAYSIMAQVSNKQFKN